MLIIKKREQEREDDYKEMMLISTLHKVYAQILAEIKGGNTKKENSAS